MPNRLQKRPRLAELNNLPDPTETRLDILLLLTIANVVLQQVDAPPGFYANGCDKIIFETMAFTSEWVNEVRKIRRTSLMMTDDEIRHTYLFTYGPERAHQLMRQHEWCHPTRSTRNQHRGIAKQNKKKNKINKETNMNKAISSG